MSKTEELLQDIKDLLEYQTKLTEQLVGSGRASGAQNPEVKFKMVEDMIFKNLKGILPVEILNKAMNQAKSMNKGGKK